MESGTIDSTGANDETSVMLPDELQKLTTLLGNSLETLAIGNPKIQTEALSTTKHIFELSVFSEGVSRPHIVDLISSLSPFHAPRTRSQTRSQAQAESLYEDTRPELFQSTPLNNLFTDGMDDKQIWAQLDLRTQMICRVLDYVLDGEVASPDLLSKQEVGTEDDEVEEEEDDEALQKALEALKREDIDMDEFLAQYGQDESDLDDPQDEDLEESSSESDGGEEEMQEDISPLCDPSSSEEDGSEYYRSSTKTSKKRKRGESSDLDDGFFDLAEFNAYTERTEARFSSRGRLAGNDSDEDEEEFDLFVASVTSNADLGDDGEAGQDPFYRDFFEPPSKIQRTSVKPISNSQVRFHENVRVRKIKATGKKRSLRYDTLDDNFVLDEDDSGSGNGCNDDEDDLDVQSESQDSDEYLEEDPNVGSEDESPEGTFQRLKFDLFAEEAEEKYDDMTTHEKRLAAIQEQIAQLETGNVAPKEWMLMGEAGSRQRPQNSLLEQDLDFERVRKAAPVVTEDVVHNLEERIKARILQAQFDDVVRIKPTKEASFLPSKLIELQDTKSKESLAKIYEAEYLATQPGGQLPDDRDGKLRKEHDEITRLWDKICSKLDALCNAHFLPNQPRATIMTMENIPSLLMESALPTSKPATDMLAPEEVFSPSTSSLKAPSELTAAEKRARRTKERKRRRRQQDILEKSVNKLSRPRGVKKEKQTALSTLVKQSKSVTIVGKESLSKIPTTANTAIAFLLHLSVVMPLFKKKPETIPPVSSPADSPSGFRPLKSNASSYVASRDGDPYTSNYSRGEYVSQSSLTDKHRGNMGVGDVYSRGEAQLEQARNELFAGYNPAKAGSGRFFDGPSFPDRAPGEETEEDVEGIKQQTRFVKQETVASSRNALRLAREAEETALNTVNRLGDQSERLANTERHLDISKTHAAGAGDRTDELKQLNRSIFRPVITWNKDAKRAAQEEKIQARYEEEKDQREKAMLDTRESQNRLGRAATYGRGGDEEELIGGGRSRNQEQISVRKEQRKRFQFDATASDDELEDELDDNLDGISDVTKRLKALGTAMGEELDKQNARIDRIGEKTVALDSNIFRNTERLKKIK